MKRYGRWAPPKLIVSLLGSTGCMLMLFAIPIGIEMAWTEFHTPYVEHTAALIFGLVMAVVVFVLGWVSLRLCMYFSKVRLKQKTELVRSTTEEIVGCLVQRCYESAVQRCVKSRLTSDDLRSAIETYGQELIVPPVEAYEHFELVRIVAAVPTWSVQAPLWTVNEGRSDLTLELTIVVNGGLVIVELDDLHVL